MRTETIEKEADNYDGEGQCYIHIEKASASGTMFFVVNGDPAAVAQATYILAIRAAEDLHVKPMELFKQYIKTWKKIGKPKATVM